MFRFPSQELLQRSEKYRRFWEGAGLSVGFFFRMLPTPTLRCLLKLESALQAKKRRCNLLPCCGASKSWGDRL